MIGKVKEREGKLYVCWTEEGDVGNSVISKELPICGFQSGHVKPGGRVEFSKMQDSYWDPNNCDCNNSDEKDAHLTCEHFVGGGINECLKGDSVKIPVARLVERKNIYAL